jgi:hypothetical protein
MRWPARSWQSFISSPASRTSGGEYKGNTAASIPIGITGGAAPSSCAPNVTSANDKLSAGTAVTVTGGTFTAALAPMSVTSFVCK